MAPFFPLVEQLPNLLAGKVSLTDNQNITGNNTFSGFTALGESTAGVKTKLLTGITAEVQGGTTTIPHNLLGNKIVGIQVFVRHIFDGFVSGDSQNYPGYGYDWYCESGTIYIQTVSNNSAFILSKDIVVLLTYVA